jgi:hypothetical protein
MTSKMPKYFKEDEVDVSKQRLIQVMGNGKNRIALLFDA